MFLTTFVNIKHFYSTRVTGYSKAPIDWIVCLCFHSIIEVEGGQHGSVLPKKLLHKGQRRSY